MGQRVSARLSALLGTLVDPGVRALGFGFVAIELLIMSLIAVSLYSMSDIRHRLDELGVQLQSKNLAVATMRENLYLRLTSSRDMMLMNDTFEIDEEAQRFRVYAARIGRAHTEFLNLTSDPTDRALAEKFMDEARQGMPLLDEAVNALISGKRPAEIQPLLNRAFRTQKQALATLEELQNRVEVQSVETTRAAVSRYDHTRVLIIVLTVVAVCAVMAIALVVARLMGNQTDELDRQRRRYKTLFDANRDAVLIVQGRRVLEGNRRAREWFASKGREELRGLDLVELSPGIEDGEQGGMAAVLDRLSGGGSFEWVFRDRSGQPFFGEVSVSPLPTVSGSRLQIMIRDITERALAQRQMSHDASHDPMTGLANRREFERRARQSIDSARTQGLHHALCYLDLDKFKYVNDMAGHEAGDELLKRVAELFRARIRAADLVARLGGDEFGVLLENCTTERASDIARAMIGDIEALEHRTPVGVFRIGVSVGLVELDADSPSYEEVVRVADMACYDAKRSGTQLRVATLPGNKDIQDRS